MIHPTEDNSLLQEIEADLARQKYEALWNRFGPALLAVAMLIVLGTAGVTAWQNHTVSGEQTRTAELTQLAEKSFDKTDDKLAALQTYAASEDDTAQASLARFHEAALMTKLGKKAEALAVYDAVAANKDAPVIFRGLADLLAVQIQLDDGDPAKLEARLHPLMADDNAWRFMATEYAGHLAVRTGDKVKAKALFEKLIAMPGVSVSLAERANDMLAWLKGGA